MSRLDRTDLRCRHGRSVAATVVTTVLALLVAACGGSGGSPSASGSSSSGAAVAYSACMRSHGVPKYPDPDSHGNLTKKGAQQFGVSTSQFQAAKQACQHLLPTGGSFQEQARQCSLTGDCPPALVRRMLSAGRIFARCMRTHGVSDWPDPTIGSEGRPYFNLSGHGFPRQRAHSSQIQSKAHECMRQSGAAPLPMG